jgi:hypothetical protein
MIKPTMTATRAPALTSHHAHQSGFRPRKKPKGRALRNFFLFEFSISPGAAAIPPLMTTYGVRAKPMRSRIAFGERKIQRPIAKPMVKPPMWEKLSRPGRSPRKNDDQDDKLNPRRLAFSPCVEEVKHEKGQDPKKTARSTRRCDTLRSIVAT